MACYTNQTPRIISDLNLSVVSGTLIIDTGFESLSANLCQELSSCPFAVDPPGEITMFAAKDTAVNNDLALERGGAISTDLGPYVMPFSACLTYVTGSTRPDRNPANWYATIVVNDMDFVSCHVPDVVATVCQYELGEFCVNEGDLVELWIKNITGNTAAQYPAVEVAFLEIR